MNEKWLSTREAAKLLGITQATVSRLIRKGKLNGEKMGGFFVVTRISVQLYAAAVDGKTKHDPTRKLDKSADSSKS